MSTEREAEWTRAPEQIIAARVAGPVLYSPIFDDVGLAGYVYCHIATGSESRAGIVVVDRPAGPSVELQRQLGTAMLGVHPLTDAAEVVADVYVEAPLAIGLPAVRRAESVDELRQ